MDTRAWRADFNVADSEGRIVSGIAVPFNSPTMIYERGQLFEETWLPGSTKDSIAKRGDRVKLLGYHQERQFPLGKPVMMEDRIAGMYAEFRISDTSAGRDALTLVQDGVLDAFSVGFQVPEGGETFLNDAGTLKRSISRAHVNEVSLVNWGAYDDARVTSLREAQDIEEVREDTGLQLLRLQVLRVRALERV